MTHAYQGVLFDLDGTLLDTAPDLGRATNVALQQYGYPPISMTTAGQVSSHGTAGLLGAALGAHYARTDVAPLRAALLNAYRQAISVDTRAFDQIDALIQALDHAQIPWGIMTNKPGWLTTPLLAEWPLFRHSKSQISGDTLTVAKPHPEPLLLAAEQIGVQPEKILYIGDAERDMVAAQRAGMTGVVALWGYLSAQDQPERWPAQHAIESPLAILDLVGLS
ncbi:HAD family hydrolase [Ferrimonas pelagia]|uniref:Phosphoglycolate phosphatase n=1 Tax=Ferrimonas pelagia TaxID=1177826 RepID=A0ABP9FIF0_9GAMM